jgi:hypothetical protein
MQIIIQLILIIGCARAAGILFKRIGQPQVRGEIAAGLVLGPSVFGALWPHGQRLLPEFVVKSKLCAGPKEPRPAAWIEMRTNNFTLRLLRRKNLFEIPLNRRNEYDR